MGTEFRPTILSLLNEVKVSDDLSSFRLDVLKKTIFKKYLGTRNQQKSLEDSALNSFIERNLMLSKHQFSETQLMRYTRVEMHMLFADHFSLYDCVSQGYCGPGSSVDTKHTDFLNKMFNSSLSTTSFNLYRHYVDSISDRWSLAESVRLSNHSLSHVVGSKISTVPKDESKRRVICTEPVLNMFYQLGAKSLIEDRLKKHHNLDVSKQPEINKTLARIGSKNQKFATIDLKDASDSITTDLIQLLLPHTTFSVLDKIRSKKTVVKGKVVDLSMFSTMGNGFTFPLMTALFSCLVRAVYQINDISPKCGVNYSVFGDDIIVLNDMYDQVCAALIEFAFTPNKEKSFSAGFFRESCGGDFLHGFPVRGVYIKELSIERPETVYTSINLLLRWSCAYGIDLSGVVGYLMCYVPIRFVSQSSPNNSGIISPRALVYFYPRDETGSIRFRRLEPVSRKYRVGGDHPNPHGALISFLGGYVRGQLVTVRSNFPLYKIQKRTDPVWDIQDYCNSPGWFSYQEFEEAIRRSLERMTLFKLE